MISLNNIAKELFESNYDGFGFVDPNLEDRKPVFELLITYDDWGLVKKIDGKDTYIVNCEDIPHEYYQGYYTWANDSDPHFDNEESWDDAYRDFDNDTQLYGIGLAFFTEDLIVNDNDITTDVDKLINLEHSVLLITHENKSRVYNEFDTLISAYLEPTAEEVKNQKKVS